MTDSITISVSWFVCVLLCVPHDDLCEGEVVDQDVQPLVLLAEELPHPPVT